MPRLIALGFILFFLVGKSHSQSNIAFKILPEEFLSPTELELYTLINEYRVQSGLPEIELSPSLCFVARTHAKDQTSSHKYGDRCNLHSWSNRGNWSSCCYTPDHRRAQCMWDKPRELTNYKGDGYEIAFYSTFKYATSEAFAKDILDGWKHSHGHNEVIINQNIWKNVKWKAIGIGIHGQYANVWFGKEEDNAAPKQSCDLKR